MTATWKTIRVFISSTFRDMHAERDHLVRFVFPELKEKCRKYRVNLIDVDLRWGVTEEDAEDGKALDICLDEIDSCRPYFLGLLGHRYGHTPPSHDHSITAQEIYHGVLQNDVPRQVVNLKNIIEGRLEGKAPTQGQIDCLMRCYLWDADKGKYLLKTDASPEELEIITAVFQQYSTYQRDRSFFFFRSESLTKRLAGETPEDFFETDEADQNKLIALKQEIIDAGLPYFDYNDIDVFGKKVGKILWERIDAEFGKQADEQVEEEKGWLEEETEYHELFIAERTRRFVGRRDLLDQMHIFCESDDETPTMVITGEPGSGKSALMGRFTEEALHKHPDRLIISHFVGASPTSTNLRQTLKRFCSQLNQLTDATEGVPEDIKELIQVFPSLIAKAAEQKNILIILDAVNQFEKTDNAHTMQWLPQGLPKNVRVVISALKGDAFDALQSRRIKPHINEVTGLNENEISELVADYLKEIRREFPNKQIEQTFFEKVKAGSPLYIQVALEELRIFGEFEALAKRVNSLPDNISTLFDQVLERIESDFNMPLIQGCMSLIACGKNGMTAEELQTLLRTHTPHINQETQAEKLPDMLWTRLYRAFSAYLFERSGVIDFFHGQLKEAVGKRYLHEKTDRTKSHKAIADYFETRWREPYNRALDELPHQRIKGQDWEGVEQVLIDLKFVEAKCMAGMTYKLVADYDLALDSLPEAQEEKQKELEQEERVKRYTEDLIAYAKGEIEHLDIIPSVRPWTEEEIHIDTERIINNPNRMDRIMVFSQFVNFESHRLHQSINMPVYFRQQAYNFTNYGRFASEARKLVNSGMMNGALFLRQASYRRDYNPHPALLKTINGKEEENYSIHCVRIADNGNTAIIGHGINDSGIVDDYDFSVRVWDLERGECLEVPCENCHHSNIVHLSIVFDGKKAVSSDGHCIRLWDIKNSKCIGTIDFSAECMDVTPDGKIAVIGSYNNLSVWNLDRREVIKFLDGYNGCIECVSITPDARKAVTGVDNALYLWDIENGIIIKNIETKGHSVNCVSITPDGKSVIYATSYDIHIWNLESGEILNRCNNNYIECLSITPDGRLALVGNSDNSLSLWDLEREECFRVLEGHTDRINGVAMTPNGKRAVSVGDDNAIRVWDLECGKCINNTKEPAFTDNTLCLTLDGMKIISRSSDSSLYMQDINSKERFKILDSQSTHINSLCATPDRKRVISGGRDGDIRIWDLLSGGCLKIIGEDKSSVEDIHITPDCKRIITRNSDLSLRVWDIESRECVKDIDTHTYPAGFLKVTPDGKVAVLARSDGSFFVYNLETEETNYFDGDESIILSDGKILCGCITPDGKKLAVGTKYNKIEVWDIKSRECVKTINGHTDKVISIIATLDGKSIISGSNDCTLRAWDLNSGESIAFYPLGTPVSSISEIHATGLFSCRTSDENNLSIFRDSSINPPLITPLRIWSYRGDINSGKWQDDIESFCKWCGQRFPVSNETLNVITAINHNAGLRDDQSPCLELPEEAWDEPRLLSECPSCNKPLKFNPFVVDNRDRY